VELEEDEEVDDDPGLSPGGVNSPPVSPPVEPSGSAPDDGEDPRRVAHELVALAHAVLTLAGRADVLAEWCPENLRDSVREAGAALAVAVGEVHVEIASGRHDDGLRGAGIGGLVGRPKRKGFRHAVEALLRVVGVRARAAQDAGPTLRMERQTAVRAWLKSAANWGKLALGSISAEIPGGHVLAEALDATLAAIDTSEALETLPNPKPS
jgi:hypothetical protein